MLHSSPFGFLSQPLYMNTTSRSLLLRVSDSTDSAAWERFVELYAPMIHLWAMKQGLRESDAADLVQDVLATLVTKLPEFQYDKSRRFRGWLYTITLNRARDWYRRKSNQQSTGLELFAESIAGDAAESVFEENEYQQFVVHRIREIMECEFEESTWKAFWLNVADGKSAPEVSGLLGMSENAVRLAKFRVLKRLRSEFDGLL